MVLAVLLLGFSISIPESAKRSLESYMEGDCRDRRVINLLVRALSARSRTVAVHS